MGTTSKVVSRKSRVIVETSKHRVICAYPGNATYPTYAFEEARANALDGDLHFVTVGAFSLEPGSIPDDAPFVVSSHLVIEMLRIISGQPETTIQ